MKRLWPVNFRFPDSMHACTTSSKTTHYQSSDKRQNKKNKIRHIYQGHYENYSTSFVTEPNRTNRPMSDSKLRFGAVMPADALQSLVAVMSLPPTPPRSSFLPSCTNFDIAYTKCIIWSPLSKVQPGFIEWRTQKCCENPLSTAQLITPPTYPSPSPRYNHPLWVFDNARKRKDTEEENWKMMCVCV